MILAIDLGSTSFKAAVFDRNLELLGQGAGQVEYLYGSGNKVEMPVEPVRGAFMQAIREALESAQVDAGQLEAVAIDSQAQTFTVTDVAGSARIPFISWQDNRAGDACKALTEDASLIDFEQHCSFSNFVAPLHICQLRHLHDHQPGLIAPRDMVLHLPTYLVRELSGQAVIDDNLAAMSGLYSLRDNEWWPSALATVGLTTAQLPKVIPVGTIATQTSASAAAFGLPPGIPIVLAGNDQTAGGYGARVAELGAVLITLGTAQVGYAAGPHPAPPGPKRVRGPYPGGLHYALVCDNVGGNVINWACTILQQGATPEAFFELAQKAPEDCGGVTFTADLNSGRGSWQGLGFVHTPAEMARAVVADLTQRMIELIGRLPLAEHPVYLVAGGGSKSALWRSMLGDSLGAELQPTIADPLLGGARMAIDAL